MGDRSLDGVVDDLPNDSWQDCVRELCIRIRAANLAHPALATLVRGAPPRRHNELMITETILGQLRNAGFDAHLAAQAYHAVIELTIGSAAIDSTMASMAPTTRDAVYDEWRSDYAALDPDWVSNGPWSWRARCIPARPINVSSSRSIACSTGSPQLADSVRAGL